MNLSILKRCHPSSVLLILSVFEGLSVEAKERLSVNEGDRIVIIGSGMASRMNHFGHFETELFLRFPDKDFTIWNMGDEGATRRFGSVSHCLSNCSTRVATAVRELAVLTYVRNSFGNLERVITPDQVAKVRDAAIHKRDTPGNFTS